MNNMIKAIHTRTCIDGILRLEPSMTEFFAFVLAHFVPCMYECNAWWRWGLPPVMCNKPDISVCRLRTPHSPPSPWTMHRVPVLSELTQSSRHPVIAKSHDQRDRATRWLSLPKWDCFFAPFLSPWVVECDPPSWSIKVARSGTEQQTLDGGCMAKRTSRHMRVRTCVRVYVWTHESCLWLLMREIRPNCILHHNQKIHFFLFLHRALQTRWAVLSLQSCVEHVIRLHEYKSACLLILCWV